MLRRPNAFNFANIYYESAILPKTLNQFTVSGISSILKVYATRFEVKKYTTTLKLALLERMRIDFGARSTTRQILRRARIECLR